jgi:hypothetical protein
MTTRTELIARLKTAASQYYLLEYRDLMSVAADMLEADEQGMKDAFASGMSCRPASVQERDKLKGEVLSLRSLLNHEYQKVTEPFPLAFHELCADLAKTKESRDTYQREADKLAAENKVLRDALGDAATSLETVSVLAGRKYYGNTPIESNMDTFSDVRGYAASRASVAREALQGANHE